ncbi:hypothetical protein Q9L58_008143 [Maublancomyces gigas]|uniref:Uncharacterized protein n=1 Tax=Discina gigas TaxID=1032678 RepID=A0ABR3GAL1_9PEZI
MVEVICIFDPDYFMQDEGGSITINNESWLVRTIPAAGGTCPVILFARQMVDTLLPEKKQQMPEVPGEALRLHTYFLWHTKITGFAMTTVTGSLFHQLAEDPSALCKMGCY